MEDSTKEYIEQRSKLNGRYGHQRFCVYKKRYTEICAGYEDDEMNSTGHLRSFLFYVS